MAPSFVYLLFLKERYLMLSMITRFGSIPSKLHARPTINESESSWKELKLHSDTRHFRDKKKDEGKTIDLEVTSKRIFELDAILIQGGILGKDRLPLVHASTPMGHKTSQRRKKTRGRNDRKADVEDIERVK
jgi:hypothetical protein